MHHRHTRRSLRLMQRERGEVCMCSDLPLSNSFTPRKQKEKKKYIIKHGSRETPIIVIMRTSVCKVDEEGDGTEIASIEVLHTHIRHFRHSSCAFS